MRDVGLADKIANKIEHFWLDKLLISKDDGEVSSIN
jgi:hypothetical protein